MSQASDNSAYMLTALLVFGLFFLFRWVFRERYSEEASRNYAIVASFICGIITFGVLK